MQERVLGAIIIGGIALVGVAWAFIDGIPPLVAAKKQEAQLETKLVEKINQKYDSNIKSIDIRRASFTTEDVLKPTRLNPKNTVKKAVISLEGYDSSNKQFECIVYADTGYILDLQNKIGSVQTQASEQMKYNLYENYSITTPNKLNEILDNSTTEFRSYSLGEEYYGILTGPSGSKIVNVGDPKVANGKKNNPYKVEDLVKMTESINKEVFVQGEVENLVKNDDETYTFDLVASENKSVKCEKVALGTGIKKVNNGQFVVIESAVVISDGNVVLKETKVGDEVLGSKVVEVSTTNPLTVGDRAISTKEASNLVTNYSYGQLSADDYYVTGVVTSVSSKEVDKSIVYTIVLETEGVAENKYFTITKATIDRTGVDASTINVGDQITARGRLSNAMCYTEYSK